MGRCFGPLDAFQLGPQAFSAGCEKCYSRALCSADELVTASRKLAPSECPLTDYPAAKVFLIQSGFSTGLYVVCSGLVFESRWDQGRQEPVSHLVGPGGIIDPATALQRTPRGAITATMLTDASIIFVPHHVVDRCLDEAPQRMRKLLEYVCTQLRLIEVRYHLRSSCDVYARVVHILLWMADLIGSVSGEGAKLPLKCDRRVLAQLVGSSPETVSRILSRLREENLVLCGTHETEILNLTMLSKIVGEAINPVGTDNSSPAANSSSSLRTN